MRLLKSDIKKFVFELITIHYEDINKSLLNYCETHYENNADLLSEILLLINEIRNQVVDEQLDKQRSLLGIAERDHISTFPKNKYITDSFVEIQIEESLFSSRKLLYENIIQFEFIKRMPNGNLSMFDINYSDYEIVREGYLATLKKNNYTNPIIPDHLKDQQGLLGNKALNYFDYLVYLIICIGFVYHEIKNQLKKVHFTKEELSILNSHLPKLDYDDLKNERLEKRIDRITKLFNEDNQDENNKKKVSEFNWFKVGLLFATGEIDEIDGSDTQKAKHFFGKDWKGFRPYITSSDYNSVVKSDKNIFFSMKKLIQLEEHCNSESKKMCDKFINHLKDSRR